MSRKRNRQRMTIHLSQENYLAVMDVVMKATSSGHGFGAVSDFFDGLVTDWRIRQAKAAQPQGDHA